MNKSNMTRLKPPQRAQGLTMSADENCKGLRYRFGNSLVTILLVQLLVAIPVILDVPIARQVVVFAYLTFAPGIVIVRLLGLDELETLEKILFYVGFSIAFLMFAGLLVNDVLPPFGISEPLSLVPLMAISDGFILLGTALTPSRNQNPRKQDFLNRRLIPTMLLLMVLPILSIVGTQYVNFFGNNLVLLFMLVVISLLFVIGILSQKLLPQRLYFLAVLMIGISLLFHYSLISTYITGNDIHQEYYILGITEKAAHWSSSIPYFWDETYGRLNSMLSITILPTFYSNLSNMDSTAIFKIIFPIIFAFVPLGLYQIWQRFLGKKYAFISAFMFMAQFTFYGEMPQLARQMVGELFFVLLILVILNEKIKPLAKASAFMIFGFALITSHYALAEIFLFFVCGTLIAFFVTKRRSNNITVTVVAFFCIAMFLWYVYTSNSSVFTSFVTFGNNLYNQLNEFLNPSSRGETVLRGLGLEASPSILNTISRIFAYITEALIVVGFVGFVARLRTKRTKVHVQKEYMVLTLLAVSLLVALILVPGLANTLNIERFYHILLFFLAPLCVIGADTVVSAITKAKVELKVSILLLVVLVPYFLFQTGFVYEVAKTESYSVPLSSYRMGVSSYVYGVPYWADVESAKFLAGVIGSSTPRIYTDRISLLIVLTSYGMIYRGNMEPLSNVTQIAPTGFVYLSRVNVIDNLVLGADAWNTTSVLELNRTNTIYSNGESEILQNSG